jgi:uncharacterized protein (TIGR02145 family)
MAGNLSTNSNPSNCQCICPSGWHLPSNSEWNQLMDYLGGYTIAGGKLKDSGTTYWNSPNVVSESLSGFNARGGGYYYRPGNWIDLKGGAFWWSTSEINSNEATARYILYYETSLGTLQDNKNSGFYVRCIKD